MGEMDRAGLYEVAAFLRHRRPPHGSPPIRFAVSTPSRMFFIVTLFFHACNHTKYPSKREINPQASYGFHAKLDTMNFISTMREQGPPLAEPLPLPERVSA